MLALPESLRSELKDPVGPVYSDATALLADAGSPIVAVGDVVTAHLLAARPSSRGRPPAVALVDGRTKREALPEDDRVDPARFDRTVDVENPPGTLSRALLSALAAAVGRADGERRTTTLIVVDGEEDLATVPAVAVVPDGGSVVYGQPDRGMVLVGVDARRRERMIDLLARMDGDVAGAFDVLGLGSRPEEADADADADG